MKPDIFIVTEHAFNKHNINYFNIEGYNLLSKFCRPSRNGEEKVWSKLGRS